MVVIHDNYDAGCWLIGKVASAVESQYLYEAFMMKNVFFVNTFPTMSRLEPMICKC